MLYPFMTLDDGTEIVHSEAMDDDGKEHVKVVIEKPIYGGFKHAECWLPEYRWEHIEGYSAEEVLELDSLVKDLAAVIITVARQGGFDNAAGF